MAENTWPPPTTVTSLVLEWGESPVNSKGKAYKSYVFCYSVLYCYTVCFADLELFLSNTGNEMTLPSVEMLAGSAMVDGVLVLYL